MKKILIHSKLNSKCLFIKTLIGLKISKMIIKVLKVQFLMIFIGEDFISLQDNKPKI